MAQRLSAYWRLCRPFTLIVPAAGIVSGAAIGLGAEGGPHVSLRTWSNSIMAAAAAVVLNAASNTINQLFDVGIDRVNRPRRPLPAGEISKKGAGVLALILFGVGLGLAWFVSPHHGGHTFFFIVVCAGAVTLAYSVPPCRLKRWWLTANLAIALARGLLLVVAGWAAVRSADRLEPWFLGAMMGLFVFGAATSKDYGDIEGDKRAGVVTLPVRFGPTRAACLTAPFYVLPFVLVPMGVRLGILTGNEKILNRVWVLFAILGGVVAYLGLRQDRGSVRRAWVGTYLLILTIQGGLAAAYLV